MAGAVSGVCFICGKPGGAWRHYRPYQDAVKAAMLLQPTVKIAPTPDKNTSAHERCINQFLVWAERRRAQIAQGYVANAPTDRDPPV